MMFFPRKQIPVPPELPQSRESCAFAALIGSHRAGASPTGETKALLESPGHFPSQAQTPGLLSQDQTVSASWKQNVKRKNGTSGAGLGMPALLQREIQGMKG